MPSVDNNDIGFGPQLGPQRPGLASLIGAKPGTTIPGPGGGTVAPYPTDTSLTIPSLVLTTNSYLSTITGHLIASVTGTWTQPTQPENVNDPNAIHNYDVQYSVLAVTNGYSPSSNAHLTHQATITGLVVGELVIFRVRANTGKVQGPWKTATITTVKNSTPPPVPSAPTIVGTLRGAAVLWDGTFAGGVPPTPDFKYAIAELSLDINFAPANIIVAGTFAAAGQTAVSPVGTAPFVVYARLKSMNTSGVFSGYSAVATGGSIQIIPEDVGAKAITQAKLNDAAVGAAQIINGAVTAFGLADSAVTSVKLSDLAVTTTKLVDDAITAVKLAADAVVPRNIVDGAVVTAKLADLAITSQKVADSAIVTSKIGDNAVDNLKLIDGGVSTSKIANGAVVASTIAAFAVTANKVGFGIGGGNYLLNSSFEDRGDPATPLGPSVVPHWAVDASCTLASVTASLVQGTNAVETTFDSNVLQQPALV